MSIVPETAYRTTESSQADEIRETGVSYNEHGTPSELIRWHAHEACELHLITATRGKVFVGDYIGRFEPGQIVLTGPYVPHNWVSDRQQVEEVALRDMVVWIRAADIEKFSQVYPQAAELGSLIDMAAAGVEFIDFDLDRAMKMMAAVRDSTGFERLLAVLDFLHTLNRWPQRQLLSTMRITAPPNLATEKQIDRVVEYVIENYDRGVSLRDAAEIAGMSESSFSRKFQKATGNRFVDFVNRVRIGRACVLLAETDQQISTICYEVGFNNVANFNRQFSRLKQCTPGKYRRQMHLNQAEVAVQSMAGLAQG